MIIFIGAIFPDLRLKLTFYVLKYWILYAEWENEVSTFMKELQFSLLQSIRDLI